MSARRGDTGACRRQARSIARAIVALLMCHALAAPAHSRAASDARDEPDALRAAVPPPAAASTTARGILDRVRPAMIQIMGFFGANTAHTFHGSGFAARLLARGLRG